VWSARHGVVAAQGNRTAEPFTVQLVACFQPHLLVPARPVSYKKTQVSHLRVAGTGKPCTCAADDEVILTGSNRPAEPVVVLDTLRVQDISLQTGGAVICRFDGDG